MDPPVFPDRDSPLPESKRSGCPQRKIDRARECLTVAPDDELGADHGLAPRVEEMQKKGRGGIERFPDEPSENGRAGKVPGDTQKGKEQDLLEGIPLAALQIVRRTFQNGIDA